MKKYIAVGHFKWKDNLTSVAETQSNMAAFKNDLVGNEFVAYIVLTEEKFHEFAGLDQWQTYNKAKKSIRNWRKRDIVSDYIGQCYDIMEERLANAI